LDDLGIVVPLWSCIWDFSIPLTFQSEPGSVVGIATRYGLDGPGIESRWGRDFPSVQTGPGAQPASCTKGTGSFPRIKSGRGVTLTPHPLLVPWSWKGRAIPLLLLWAVRPVQSLSVCTRVHFTLAFTFQTASGIHPAPSFSVTEALTPRVRRPWLAAEHSTPNTDEIKMSGIRHILLPYAFIFCTRTTIHTIDNRIDATITVY
jgi:hypothetical protein